MPRATKRPIGKPSTAAKPGPRGKPSIEPAIKPKDMRDPVSGKFVGRLPRWQELSDRGFFAWLNDNQVCVKQKGRYEPIRLARFQEQIVRGALAPDDDGLKNQIVAIIGPRRMFKTGLNLLIALWLADSRPNTVVQLQGATEAQSRKAQFATLQNWILATKGLKERITERGLNRDAIRLPNGSLIQAMVSTGLGSQFGDKVDVIVASELHAWDTVAIEAFQALQNSLIDSPNALLLCDGNPDQVGQQLHKFEVMAKDDPRVFCHRIRYFDAEHYFDTAPAWIDRAWARRQQKALLEADFKRDFLGQRSSAANALFKPGDIDRCKDAYSGPAMNISELVQGRDFKVCAALDRSRALFGSVTGHDNSIITAVAVVASMTNSEPEYYILDEIRVKLNTAAQIKQHILELHVRYKLNMFVAEEYQALDLQSWLDDQRIPNQLISPTNAKQNSSFVNFHRIVKEGRLHIPANCEKLRAEMLTFEYRILKSDSSKYGFGAAGSSKDDRVYALNWAIFGLRDTIQRQYVLNHIFCAGTRSREFCALLGGDKRLYCSRECVAWGQVEDFYREYKKFNTESHIDLLQFYRKFVRLAGSVIYSKAA